MAISQVCALPAVFLNLNQLPVERTGDILRHVRELAPNASYTVLSCSFGQDGDDCDDLWNEGITEDGLCFTFNALNGKQLYHDG